MHGSAFEVNTSDGRVVHARVAGPERGPLLVYHVGTPGVNRVYASQLAAGTDRGLRVVCCSRPGYGRSARLPDRSIADCAEDVAAVADALAAPRFYVFGHSSGAPHALACAAAMPERVLAAAAVSGFAPRQVVGDGWGREMAAENRAEFDTAARGGCALLAYLEAVREEWQEVRTLAQLEAAFREFFNDADREALLSGGYLGYQLECVRQIAGEAVWGWFDDDRAAVTDWGFAVEEIAVPVTIWHGEEDPAVPAWHGPWLAQRIAGSRLHLLPGEGHISLLNRHCGAILDELIELGER